MKKMTPTVVTFEVLKKLCYTHRYEIGKGMFHLLPQISIRYVNKKREFGYAKFGEFFFLGDDMYVWKKGEEYQEEHNQDVVDEVFDGECAHRGYACRRIFSGVMTKYKDSNGEYIYTGDVLRVHNASYDPWYFAVGAITSNGYDGWYGFLLDNHSWRLSDCMEENVVTRIGSVFYQIDENAASEEVNYRTLLFNNNRYDEIDKETQLLMASYTPNTDQEVWKYQALTIIGAEPWFK